MIPLKWASADYTVTGPLFWPRHLSLLAKSPDIQFVNREFGREPIFRSSFHPIVHRTARPYSVGRKEQLGHSQATRTMFLLPTANDQTV